jgi:hypothetical protein
MAEDRNAIARQIIDGGRYMTLATAGADGRPWASPVWYAPALACDEFIWVSHPEAQHSRNIAERPEIALVIFDSAAVPGEGQAVYVAASAAQLEGDDLATAIEVFSARSEAQGIGPWTVAHVDGSAAVRLYRAVATGHWILDKDHPEPGDHRVAVRP